MSLTEAALMFCGIEHKLCIIGAEIYEAVFCCCFNHVVQQFCMVALYVEVWNALTVTECWRVHDHQVRNSRFQRFQVLLYIGMIENIITGVFGVVDREIICCPLQVSFG